MIGSRAIRFLATGRCAAERKFSRAPRTPDQCCDVIENIDDAWDFSGMADELSTV